MDTIDDFSDDYYSLEEIAPSVTGNTEEDWTTVAHLCASALAEFNPAKWMEETDKDLQEYLQKQIQWYSNQLTPALRFFYEVSDYYSTNTTEPF